MNEDTSIGERLKLFRELKNLSQEDVALAADISITYYGQLERNQKLNPSLAIIEKLCEIFEISLSDFFSNNEIVNNQSLDNISSQVLLLIRNRSDEEKFHILQVLKNMIDFKEC